MAAGQPSYPPPPTERPRYGGRPYIPPERSQVEYIPNYLTQAILVTIFCCLPAGIVSIVYAAQVNGKAAAGDIEGARRDSNNAKTWAWVAFGLALAIVGVYVLIFNCRIGSGIAGLS